MSRIMSWMTNQSVQDNHLSLSDEDRSYLTQPSADYDYRQRSPQSISDGVHYAALWPRSAGLNDGATAFWPLGCDAASVPGQFEPTIVYDSHVDRPYFVHGQVTDQNATPLVGTRVDLFLTGTEVYVARATADGNGVYSIATPVANVGLPHFAIANYSNNTLVGMSRNDLIPTLAPY